MDCLRFHLSFNDKRQSTASIGAERQLVDMRTMPHLISRQRPSPTSSNMILKLKEAALFYAHGFFWVIRWHHSCCACALHHSSDSFHLADDVVFRLYPVVLPVHPSAFLHFGNALSYSMLLISLDLIG